MERWRELVREYRRDSMMLVGVVGAMGRGEEGGSPRLGCKMGENEGLERVRIAQAVSALFRELVVCWKCERRGKGRRGR